MPKVSVVIPIYNAEPYLRQRLDSICEQTLEEIEVICVDDGSTDSSWEILEEYRKKDPRFRLFRQGHLNVSAARNNGLSQAEGKYVMLQDSDDFFEPNALELLYRRAEETGAEVCVCSYDLYDHQTGKRYPAVNALHPKRIPEGDTFNRFTNPEHILSFSHTVVWNKMILRRFLIEKDIRFSNFWIGEESAFSFAVLCSASKITTVNKDLIHYRYNNPESLVKKVPKDPLEPVRAHDFAIDQLIERNIAPMEWLGRRVLQLIREELQRTTTEEGFVSVFNTRREAKSGLIQKCNIVEREPGYYYTADDDEFVKHLLHDPPGDMLAYMMHDFWQKNGINAAKRRRLETEFKAVKEELKATKVRLKMAEKKLDALQNSRSYRLGRALLFLPRKIRDLFRRIA